MQDQPGSAPAVPAIADDAFGADMYRLLSERAPDTVFSPVSVAAALRMALCGARGQTAAELAARPAPGRLAGQRRPRDCARWRRWSAT